MAHTWFHIAVMTTVKGIPVRPRRSADCRFLLTPLDYLVDVICRSDAGRHATPARLA
jgi:hypothetical protein